MTGQQKKRRYAEADLPRPYETMLDGYRVRISFIAPVTKAAKAQCELARSRREYAALQSPPESIVRGYRVRTILVPCSPKEWKAKMAALARIFAQSDARRRAESQ